jgi:exosortase
MQQEANMNDRSPACGRRKWIAGGCLLAAAFLWSYWPALGALADTWNHVPDYSHGYLVPPLALIILWARRDRMPAPAAELSWPGLVLIAFSIAMRYAGAWYYLEPLEGWSIMPWVAGIIWLFFGWGVLRWGLPSVAFLFFMVRIPMRAEDALSLPLQTIATRLSCWGLQMLGQPAISEGHVVYIGEHPLEIATACSGLRIFVGIAALAFACVAIARRSWWEKALLLASFLPIALIANATRIVATGLLWEYASGEAAKKFSHDIAGLAMILYAAALFALAYWYLTKLVVEVEPLDMGAVIRRENE